jgi:hypothetical protein
MTSAERNSIRFVLNYNLDEDDYEDPDYRRKKKRSRQEKLDVMDRKLRTIENLIIEDTAKYYDNHDGMFIISFNTNRVSQLSIQVA